MIVREKEADQPPVADWSVFKRFTIKKTTCFDFKMRYIAYMVKQESIEVKDNDLRRCKNRALVFKALAHATRIRIVEALSQREHCVCELVDLIGDDMSTISKHLSLMRSAGIVSSDRRGTSVHYRLKMHCVPGFMTCVDKAIVESAREQIGAAA